MLLLLIELTGHFGESLPLSLADILTLLVDLCLPLLQLFVLVLEVDESAAEPFDLRALTQCFVCDDVLKEVSIDLMAFKLSFPFFDLVSLLFDACV